MHLLPRVWKLLYEFVTLVLFSLYIYTEVKMKDPTIHKKRKYESPYQVPTLLLRVSSPSFLAWEVSTRSNQGQDTSATTPFGLRGPDTATLFSGSLHPAVLHPTGTGTSSPTKHEVVWPERDSASRQSFSVLPRLSAGQPSRWHRNIELPGKTHSHRASDTPYVVGDGRLDFMVYLSCLRFPLP